MANSRHSVLEYIRGISMLGVVGIHTGAYSLSNPEVNKHLFAVLEILTRFSVPIFFFISAFGLFYKQDLSAPFNYKSFLLRRSRGVFIPYILWSIIYMLHYTWETGDTEIWSPPIIYEYFLFGLASYQLYFLVILIWFYLFMPLWRIIIKRMNTKPVFALFVLLLLQIVFNYYSCYLLALRNDNYYLNLAIDYRLSYLVLHYVFIFLLGAMCAVYFEAFQRFIQSRRTFITLSFWITLSGMLAHYYYLLYYSEYTPEAAVNVVQQLSPIGVLYTAAITLFLYMRLSDNHLPATVTNTLHILGKYSFPVYLIHPMVMYYLSDYFTKYSLVMDIFTTLFFLVVTIMTSLMFGFFAHQLAKSFPLVCSLLIGIKRQSAKTEAQ